MTTRGTSTEAWAEIVAVYVLDRTLVNTGFDAFTAVITVSSNVGAVFGAVFSQVKITKHGIRGLLLVAKSKLWNRQCILLFSYFPKNLVENVTTVIGIQRR